MPTPSTIETRPNVEIPEDFKCAITQDLMIYPTKTNCSHTFEKSAIERWINENGRCPLCRNYITTVTLDQDLTRRIDQFVRDNNLIGYFNEIKSALPNENQPITTRPTSRRTRLLDPIQIFNQFFGRPQDEGIQQIQRQLATERQQELERQRARERRHQEIEQRYQNIQTQSIQTRNNFFRTVLQILSLALIFLGIVFISRLILKIVFVPLALLLNKANA